MAKNRHWIWSAYLALGEQGGMTSQQGIEQLKSWFPSYAEMVEPVVAAMGDRSRIPASMLERDEEIAEQEEAAILEYDVRDELRRIVTGRKVAANHERDASGRFYGNRSNQSDSENMNAQIRTEVFRNRVPVGTSDEDMTAQIRALANRGRFTTG